jgi:hypothetical protein
MTWFKEPTASERQFIYPAFVSSVYEHHSTSQQTQFRLPCVIAVIGTFGLISFPLVFAW